ncbi:MAG: DJ-1/PfpI family protein [Oscillospiraceae bacterium]|nr:DJ-1/PfpI family protein [Oscillospiraceae bacterium]
MIYVFLAEGCEEIEALTPVDCLRRAGKQVITVGVGSKVITGSHGISITADMTENEVQLNDSLEMVVLPGGMPGTLHLGESEAVKSAVMYAFSHDRFVTAICAAPSVLGDMGLLKGKKAVCYPGFETRMTGCISADQSAVRDGKIITGKGPGAAMDFSLLLVEALCGSEKKEQLAASMVYHS